MWRKCNVNVVTFFLKMRQHFFSLRQSKCGKKVTNFYDALERQFAGVKGWPKIIPCHQESLRTLQSLFRGFSIALSINILLAKSTIESDLTAQQYCYYICVVFTYGTIIRTIILLESSQNMLLPGKISRLPSYSAAHYCIVCVDLQKGAK